MKGTRLAPRYAKSLLDLALDQGALEKVYADLKMLIHICQSSDEFSIFLKSPIIKTDKKLTIIKEIFGERVHPISLAFINIIVRKKREFYLEAIAQEFINQYKQHKHILTAVITSARGLDDTLRKQVLEVVKKGTDSEIELVEKVNNDLIGGFILRIGDRQVDSSIARKIKNLKGISKKIHTLGKTFDQYP